MGRGLFSRPGPLRTFRLNPGGSTPSPGIILHHTALSSATITPILSPAQPLHRLSTFLPAVIQPVLYIHYFLFVYGLLPLLDCRVCQGRYHIKAPLPWMVSVWSLHLASNQRLFSEHPVNEQVKY